MGWNQVCPVCTHFMQRRTAISLLSHMGRSAAPVRKFHRQARLLAAVASNTAADRPMRTTVKPLQPRSRTAIPAAPAYLSRQQSYAQTLSKKSSPTTLYLAPTTLVYPYTCLAFSGWCLTHGLYQLYDAYLVTHPGLLWIIPHLMAGVGVFFLGTGSWIGLGAKGHLSSLTALPTREGGAANPMALRIRAERRGLVPGLRPAVLEAAVQNVRLGESVKGMLEERDKENRQTQRDRLENMSAWRALTSPIRDGWRFLSRGTRRVIQREGFADLYINGERCRVDVRDGWLLDKGAGLDRLFHKAGP